jgi:hypothetical protein
MRPYPFIDHAALYQQRCTNVCRTVEGGIHRTSYPEIRQHALKLARA